MATASVAGAEALVPAAPAEALEALYRSHYRAMVRLAGLLLGDYQAGEEIAQEAFARLFQRWGRTLEPAGYLRATVVNLSRSRIRRALVARRHRPDPDPDAAGPEAGTESLAVRLALRRALAGLPARQREAVVLRFYGGLRDTEVAAAMGVSPGAVKSHLHRALARLGPELEELR